VGINLSLRSSAFSAVYLVTLSTVDLNQAEIGVQHRCWASKVSRGWLQLQTVGCIRRAASARIRRTLCDGPGSMDPVVKFDANVALNVLRA